MQATLLRWRWVVSLLEAFAHQAGSLHFQALVVGPDQLHGFEERLTTDISTSGSLQLPVTE